MMANCRFRRKEVNMKKLLNVQEKVKDILMKHPRTRSNDMLLYLKFAEQIDEEYQQNVMKLPFATVIGNMEEYHLPTFGSVGRARRKLQEKYPELRAIDQVQGFRADREEAYREYARKEQ